MLQRYGQTSSFHHLFSQSTVQILMRWTMMGGIALMNLRCSQQMEMKGAAYRLTKWRGTKLCFSWQVSVVQGHITSDGIDSVLPLSCSPYDGKMFFLNMVIRGAPNPL